LSTNGLNELPFSANVVLRYHKAIAPSFHISGGAALMLHGVVCFNLALQQNTGDHLLLKIVTVA